MCLCWKFLATNMSNGVKLSESSKLPKSWIDPFWNQVRFMCKKLSISGAFKMRTKLFGFVSLFSKLLLYDSLNEQNVKIFYGNNDVHFIDVLFYGRERCKRELLNTIKTGPEKLLHITRINLRLCQEFFLKFWLNSEFWNSVLESGFYRFSIVNHNAHHRTFHFILMQDSSRHKYDFSFLLCSFGLWTIAWKKALQYRAPAHRWEFYKKAMWKNEWPQVKKNSWR